MPPSSFWHVSLPSKQGSGQKCRHQTCDGQANAAPARRDGHGCLSGFRTRPLRRAAPLLSQKRKGGWNAEEKWSAVCFSWLSDAGENASLSDGPLAHKKKQTVQKQIERWKADERFADTMSLMVDTPPGERPSLIAQIRKVSTSEGKRRAGRRG